MTNYESHNGNAESAINAWMDSGLAALPPEPPSLPNDPPPPPPARPSSRTEPFRSKADQPPPETEEDQIRRATAISLGQESGVTLTSTHHDSAPDALVREIILPPEPRARSRGSHPAILRPLATAGSLHALLTILHTIPMAREAFLAPAKLLTDYGQDEAWWDGTLIRLPHIAEPLSDPLQAGLDDLVAELQRLMAFLDQTGRSYGSVAPLSSLCASVDCQASRLGQFLATWQKATLSSDLFDFEGVQRSVDDQRKDTIRTMQLTVNPSMIGRRHSLLDVLDAAIWSDEANEDTFFAKFGHIFIIEADNAHSSGLGVDLPPTLPLQRYSESNLASVRGFKQQKKAAAAEMARLQHIRETLTAVPNSNAETLLSTLTQYLENLSASAQIESTLHDLAEVRSSVLARLQESTMVEEPQMALSDSQDYRLCGFSTRPTIIYTRLDDVWRRAVFDNDAPTSVSTTRLTESEALEAGRQESPQVLAIYASVPAILHPREPLPTALRAFVAADNAAFAAELADHQR